MKITRKQEEQITFAEEGFKTKASEIATTNNGTIIGQYYINISEWYN